MLYNYREGKKRITEILNSANNVDERNEVPNDSAFDYGNAIIAPVASIFVDIRKSSNYFTIQPKKQVAKMIRSYVSELVEVFRKNPNIREVGIRGDCVYSIYSADSVEALESVIDDATNANTIIKMLNELLAKRNYKTINVGIGLGYDGSEFIIKAGRKGSGISDLVWIGKSVIDASNCCALSNRLHSRKGIVISSDFYDRIKKSKANSNQTYGDLFSPFWDGGIKRYSCNLVVRNFDNWINGGMTD